MHNRIKFKKNEYDAPEQKLVGEHKQIERPIQIQNCL